jgi:hypothetical protein
MMMDEGQQVGGKEYFQVLLETYMSIQLLILNTELVSNALVTVHQQKETAASIYGGRREWKTF